MLRQQSSCLLLYPPAGIAKTGSLEEKEAPRIPSWSGYAPIQGLRLYYYEIYGVANPCRPPLVLLRGGGDTVETSFGHMLPEIARDRQIIAFEQRGGDIPIASTHRSER